MNKIVEPNSKIQEQSIVSVSDVLNGEKWTRIAIDSYKVGNFRQLDKIIEKSLEENSEKKLLIFCEEHLINHKNSITALYIAGVLCLHRHSVDDNNMIVLMNIFVEHHKWSVVEYLAKKIITFGENKIALRRLAECYQHTDQTIKMYQIWERLIKVDFEEADLVRQIARMYESKKDVDESTVIEYYKKALNRYISKLDFSNTRDIWRILIHYMSDDWEFFRSMAAKVAKQIGKENATELLRDLFHELQKDKKWNIAINLLKVILVYDPKNEWARSEIITCYSACYYQHSNLEEFIRISDLRQGWRNVHEAIADFEKHISFDVGNFTFHRSWGVGIIRKIEGEFITIDFAKKRGHAMTFKIAVTALEILSKNHIWVLRTIIKREKLHDMIKSNIVWALKTLIKSFHNAADMKRIKNELVPYILSQAEWSNWSVKARNILKTSKEFGSLVDRPDHFEVRTRPISFEEKTHIAFQAERLFSRRLKMILDFISSIEDGEISGDSDRFRDMLQYFLDILTGQSIIDEKTISSFLLIERIGKKFPYMYPDTGVTFLDIIEQIDDLPDIYSKINNADIQHDFVYYIKTRIKDWASYYITLLPHTLSKTMILDLLDNGYKETVCLSVRNAIQNYRDNPTYFIWILKTYYKTDWFVDLQIPDEKILSYLIHLFDLTARNIENRNNIILNRRLHKYIYVFLFDNRVLNNFILNENEDSIGRIFSLLQDVRDIDPLIIIDLKQKILDLYPSFNFHGEEQREVLNRGGLITCQTSYQRKQSELQEIHDVLVPQNSREIGLALQYGDLRENAEYKAAKERQEILNSTAFRLREELDRARIVNSHEVNEDISSFGTKIKLLNEQTSQEEEYIIMGPWESDPDRYIISYRSPFGNELCNRKIGDKLDFTINEINYRYTVQNIKVHKF